MSDIFSTPSKKKLEKDDEILLGSYYRLKSCKKLMEKIGKSQFIDRDEEDLNESTIYTTPIRSSRRIKSNQKNLNNNAEFDILEGESSKQIFVTPNPYIKSDLVQDLLNDLLAKYRDKIHIISFDKQPQIKLECNQDKLPNKLDEDIDDLEKKLCEKLSINNEENGDFNSNRSDINENNVNSCDQNDKNVNIGNFGNKSKNDNEVKEFNSSAKRAYFVCRNKQRTLIGGKSHIPKDEYKILAENEYWMVVEFSKKGALHKKYNCSRILTQKKILGNPIKYPQIQSIDEYKALHSELKKLLELSNYCYSPDLI